MIFAFSNLVILSFKINDATILISPDEVTCIEIFDRDAEVPEQGVKSKYKEDVRYGALLHFSLYVDNVDAIYEKALAHGAKPVVPPTELKLGTSILDVYNAVFEGLNDEIIEVIKNASFKIR